MSRAGRVPSPDAAYEFGPAYVPENELMRAIILRAIEDFQQGGQHMEDAKVFFEDEDEDYVFSFRAICHTLHIDPDKMREKIYNRTKRISTRRRTV